MTNEFWNKAWAKETQGLDFATARKAGRATKENPNKEDAVWWDAKSGGRTIGAVPQLDGCGQQLWWCDGQDD